MKAFEKMEKRNARKASQDQCNKGKVIEVKKEREPLKEKDEKEGKNHKKEKERVVCIFFGVFYAL